MFCASSASATCRFDPSVERNPANTLCPERERVSAVKRPKPLDAPVIRIVFPIVFLESLRLKVTAHCRYCPGEDRDDLTLNLLLAIPHRPRTRYERRILHPLEYCAHNHSLGRGELAKVPYVGQILPDPQPIYCFGFLGFLGTMKLADVRLLLESN